MKATIKASFIILMAILLNACANSGNQKIAKIENHASLDKTLVSGKTTKEKVKLAFGEPSDVDFDNNNNEKWTYTHIRRVSKAINFMPYANYLMRGTDDTNKKLVIVFDKNGVVQKYAFTKSKGETKVGVFG